MKPHVCLSFVAAAWFCISPLRAEDRLEWSKPLPDLPDKHGFAGMFAGVSGKVLVAAGGANFPGAPPWQGGTKVWHDTIYVLAGGEKWIAARDKLPRPLAYGVSLTVRHASIRSSDHRGVVCIGGDDGKQARQEVFLLTWDGESIHTTPLPQLPKPCTQMCGAQVGDVLYLAGGAGALDATKSMRTFWALDLPAALRGSADDAAWRELEPWPGPERTQAVAASAEGAFLLFGGVQLKADQDGKPTRVTPYLRDAYRYTPEGGEWKQLAELPHPVAAAPSPAPIIDGEVVVLGGVDGSLFFHDQATHPGFTRRTLLYQLAANRWREGEPMPEGVSRVTVPCVPWLGGYAIVSGESRPGVRSPAVNRLRPR
jgi:N-acetylneuraminic acid mutarotase